MTIACHQMADRKTSEDSIRATEEIKRNYLQLMTMKNQDARCVVEAFIVDTANLTLTRAVSVDEDQVGAREQPIVTMPLPQASFKSATQTLCASNNKIATTSGTWQDMFSPCTDDMKSVPIEPDDEYEADDLRRTVGSNDYDDQAEKRDAAEDGRREGNSGSEQSVQLQNMVFYSWGAAELAATPTPLRKYQ